VQLDLCGSSSWSGWSGLVDGVGPVGPVMDKMRRVALVIDTDGNMNKHAPGL